ALVLPGQVPGCDHAIRDHVNRLVERELFPLRALRPAVLDLVLAAGRVHQLSRGGALGAQAPAGNRAARIPLDLHDGLVLHVDLLSAADSAVWADRVDHAVRGRGAWPE